MAKSALHPADLSLLSPKFESLLSEIFSSFLCQIEALIQPEGSMDEFGPDKRTNLEAFSLLVEEHQGAVRSFVTARIDDAFEAEDIAQEAFLIAFRKLGEVDQSRPIRPWLCAIAGNLVKNYRRKRRARPVGGSSDVILDLLDAEVEVLDSSWQASSLSEPLEYCLGKLGEAGRELIRLRYEEGLGISQIRSSLGGKHSTLTMKLHRIREQLRVCIEGQISEEASHG